MPLLPPSPESNSRTDVSFSASKVRKLNININSSMIHSFWGFAFTAQRRTHYPILQMRCSSMQESICRDDSTLLTGQSALGRVNFGLMPVNLKFVPFHYLFVDSCRKLDRCSQFWHGYRKVRELFEWGRKHNFITLLWLRTIRSAYSCETQAPSTEVRICTLSTRLCASLRNGL